MRYCEYCGTPLDDDASFCTQCGHRLSAIPTPSAYTSTPKDNSTAEDQRAKTPEAVVSSVNDDAEVRTELSDSKEKKNTIFFIIGGIVLAAAVIAGVLLFTNKDKNSKDDVEEDDEQQEQPSSAMRWNGDYTFNGEINSEWTFDMRLHIYGSDVSGEYQVHGSGYGYVRIVGTITPDGIIRADEYNPNGTPTGYYFQGTFTKNGITGKYLSTRRQLNMSFYAR